MECRHDEHPKLVKQYRQSKYYRRIDREFELRQDRVGRPERVQLHVVEIRVLEKVDRVRCGNEQDNAQPEDRDDRYQETFTELPQVLRKAHFLLVPCVGHEISRLTFLCPEWAAEYRRRS